MRRVSTINNDASTDNVQYHKTAWLRTSVMVSAIVIYSTRLSPLSSPCATLDALEPEKRRFILPLNILLREPSQSGSSGRGRVALGRYGSIDGPWSDSEAGEGWLSASVGPCVGGNIDGPWSNSEAGGGWLSASVGPCVGGSILLREPNQSGSSGRGRFAVGRDGPVDGPWSDSEAGGGWLSASVGPCVGGNILLRVPNQSGSSGRGRFTLGRYGTVDGPWFDSQAGGGWLSAGVGPWVGA